MTENPQAPEDLKEKREKSCEEPDEPAEESSWSEDQKRRGYYYDDAHGYEVYKEEETGSEGEEENFSR